MTWIQPTVSGEKTAGGSCCAWAGTGRGDLERALARIHASSAAEAEGANAAIYYEDTAKRKVLSLVTALRGLQSLQVACCLSANSIGEASDPLLWVWGRLAKLMA